MLIKQVFNTIDKLNKTINLDLYKTINGMEKIINATCSFNENIISDFDLANASLDMLFLSIISLILVNTMLKVAEFIANNATNIVIRLLMRNPLRFIVPKNNSNLAVR